MFKYSLQHDLLYLNQTKTEQLTIKKNKLMVITEYDTVHNIDSIRGHLYN